MRDLAVCALEYEVAGRWRSEGVDRIQIRVLSQPAQKLRVGSELTHVPIIRRRRRNTVEGQRDVPVDRHGAAVGDPNLPHVMRTAVAERRRSRRLDNSLAPVAETGGGISRTRRT